MLSDEEKTALEFIKINNEHKYCGKDDVDFLLNLIEKQSKEIEELNKSDASKEQSSMNYYNLYKELLVDIKAKIEELDKEEKEALKGTKGQDRYAIKQEYMHKRSVLQSLLEKE